MLKNKKTKKAFDFKNRFTLLLVFAFLFGSFGVYKLAFSSAASFTTIKSVSGLWTIKKGAGYTTFSDLNIILGGFGNGSYGGGTYRYCALVKSGGDPSLASNTSTFQMGPQGFQTVASVGPKQYVTKCTKTLTESPNSGSYFAPAIALDSSSKNSLIVKQVYWQKDTEASSKSP